MKIVLINSKYSNNKHIEKLHFKMLGENQEESALPILPETLKSLDNIGLNSYVIKFSKNNHDQFDVEIIARYPRVLVKEQKKFAAMSVFEKGENLENFFYKNTDEYKKELESFTEFRQYLSKLVHCHSWSDEDLYNFPRCWDDIAKAYRTLNEKMTKREQQEHPVLNLDDDEDYKRIKHQNDYYLDSMTQRPCAFDQERVIKEQGIINFNHFRIAFNYLPYANSPLHLMIISNGHSADLTTATEQHLSELESIFRTLYQFAAKNQPLKNDQNNLKIVSQKQTSSGMTIHHLHFQVLIPPSENNLNNYFLQQLRFLSRSQAKLSSANECSVLPLTPIVMQEMAVQYKETLKQEFQKQTYRQYQKTAFFKFSRSLVKNHFNSRNNFFSIEKQHLILSKIHFHTDNEKHKDEKYAVERSMNN